MKDIISTLNFKANNIEEICCGIRNYWEDFQNKNKRKKLIEEIEYELEQFNDALNQLKAIE